MPLSEDLFTAKTRWAAPFPRTGGALARRCQHKPFRVVPAGTGWRAQAQAIHLAAGPEYEDAVREGLISESERSAALAVVGELGPRITGHDPLFDEIGWKHLAAACRLSLPPLRNLP